jgi:uncharacterized protein YdcH (DUF465 family)
MVRPAIGDRRPKMTIRPTEPENPQILRLGVDLTNQFIGERLMETNTQDELKAHLMATSNEFRDLASQHAHLHKQLEDLEAKAHLTDEEQIEEVRLKKQKLHVKDQMNQILARSRAQVA